MDFLADPLGNLVAFAFGFLGCVSWGMALWKVGKGGSVGLQERWGGFGHGLGGWQVTPAFALILIGASAVGITLAVMQSLPEPSLVQDADADGVIDRDDRCPAAVEDFDGHWDNDGCPDPDNDEDGRLDDNDQCPANPEDIDGFEDIDGCPDPDNDEDSIPDDRDDCPRQAEDRDRFEDDDGCPDPDNDGDGICDPGIDPALTGAACIRWDRRPAPLTVVAPDPSPDLDPAQPASPEPSGDIPAP